MATNKTQNFNMSYFSRGASYSGTTDYRRFVTLDYNLASYVGIIGSGIIDGWEVQTNGGLNIQITPGRGILDGLAVRSPYTYLSARTQLVIGEREIEPILDMINSAGDVVTYPILAGQDLTNYANVITAYDPSFDVNTAGDIENCPVLYSNCWTGSVTDNAESYIYATTPLAGIPYPPASDYPVFNAVAPNIKDYTNYANYAADLSTYQNGLATIHNYEWRANPSNHYDAVGFLVSPISLNSSSMVFLGRAVAESGSIIKIDVSEVENLYQLSSQIEGLAKELLSKHEHGGSLPFDPPQINLQTDIRDTALKIYHPTTKQSVFYVLEKQRTSISLGHDHSFYFDTNGNGLTVGVLGTGSIANHFHLITGGIVGTPELSSNNVASHIHTLPTADQLCCWTADSPFEVIANGKVFGDNTSSAINVDISNKLLTLSGAVGASYNKYTLSIPLNIPARSFFVTVNGVQQEFDSPAIVTTFTFTESAYSVLAFMLDAMNAFHAQFNDQIYGALNSAADAAPGEGQVAQALFDSVYAEDPFTFLLSSVANTTLSASANPVGAAAGAGPLLTTTTTYDVQITGLDALMQQCAVAQTQLLNVGDAFIFTPNAARNVTVTLLATSSNNVLYNVQLEILGDTEVTGILSTDNIAFVNASLFQLGEFNIARIPFISHVGRMGEQVIPFQYPLISNNSIQYMVSPATTSVVLGHYHRMDLDTAESGITTQTMMGNSPVYYATGQNGDQFLIDHIHSVSDGSIDIVDSSGIVAWQNDLYGTNLVSAAHTHTIVQPLVGNPKIVYSMAENSNGDLFAGTSGGMLIIPQEIAYLFVVNGLPFNGIGNDLWSVLNGIKLLYEKRVITRELVVTWDIYGSQIITAETVLDSSGKSIMFFGYNDPLYGQDQIMVKRVSSFEVPNFTANYYKKSYAVQPNETIIGQEIIDLSTGNQITPEVAATLLLTEVEVLLKTEKDLSPTPIWSVIVGQESNSETIVTTGGDLFARSVDLINNPYASWTVPDLPVSIGTIKKAFRDSNNNYWLITSNGLFVSRNGYQGKVITSATQAGLSANINDIVETNTGYILVATDDGLYQTNTSGSSWTEVLTSATGFSQVIRDYTLATTLYSIDKNGTVNKSSNNGSTWLSPTVLPEGENGSCFAYNGLLVSKPDGLYLFNGTRWNKVFGLPVYAFAMRYNLTGLLLGCYNSIYSTNDLISFTLSESFEGYPNPIIYRDGIETLFGYAYSSKNNSFYFKDPVYDSNQTWALVDFSEWFAVRGPWKNISPYDVYVDNYLVLSTKLGLDNRTKDHYIFTVSPEEGSIKFSTQANLTQTAKIYSGSLAVDAANTFNPGDYVFIKSNAVTEVSPNIDFLTSVPPSSTVYYAELASYLAYLDNVKSIENMYFFGNVSGVSNNQLLLNESLDKTIELPATVTRIPNINGNTPVLMNIFESPLINIGTFSHEELEDGLSAYADGKSYTMNNSFLSNLLQLTQAVSNTYPTISSNFKNTKFYDLKYSLNPLDPNYIGHYIDLFNSDINNSSIFTTDFSSASASVINKILFGFGPFADNVLVATDIGIFWAKVEDGLEGSWFYVSNITTHVYDMAIFGNSLAACTTDGTYITTDMVNWELQSNTPADFPATRASLRWIGGDDMVSVSNHAAAFESGYLGNNALGTITSSELLYTSFLENRKIDISLGPDSPNNTISGIYTIKLISANTVTNVNTIVTYEDFGLSNSNAITEFVSIRMGAWWEYLNSSVSSENPAISNTLLVGGLNNIAYCSNAYGLVWNQAALPAGTGNFQVSSFCPTTTGLIFASTVGTETVNPTNYVFECSGDGSAWNTLQSIETIFGEIVGSSLTAFLHTKLSVQYDTENEVYINGSASKQNISVYRNGALIYTGDVLFNEKTDQDYIYVTGDALYNLLSEDTTQCSFIVSPNKVNCMLETADKKLLYGTDNGLYSDNGGVLQNKKISGVVTDVGVHGLVGKIDINGTVTSVFSNNFGNAVLSITTNEAFSSNGLVGRQVYILVASGSSSYNILSNTGKNINGEAAIEVQIPYSSRLGAFWIGKQVVIQGLGSSMVYFQPNVFMQLNQFNGGKLYIVSNENKDARYSFSVIRNGLDYVEISPAVVPASPYASVEASGTLLAGQSICLVDSSQRLDLFVNFTKQVLENELTGNSIVFTGGTMASSISGITVFSNGRNSLKLKALPTVLPMSFAAGNAFTIEDFKMKLVANFNNRLTTVSDIHYHEVNTIGAMVTGKIASFANVGTSYVDIIVANTIGFNSTLVQTRGDLFTDATIYFYNPLYTQYWFTSEVVSYTSTQLTVRVKDVSNWNFTEYQQQVVSNTWAWQIDASNYGYTEDLIYIEGVANIFSNNHVHQIRNNQLETVYVAEYLANGYSSTHSHAPTALLPHIAKLSRNGEEIVAVGSSENVFVSYNNGNTWEGMVNVNDWIEYGNAITTITELELDSNAHWIVGTDKGYLLSQSNVATNVPLERPSLEE